MKKAYDQLMFHDDFMFCKVLQNNPDLCRELLVLILGKEIGELLEISKQKPIEITSGNRGVRFDVYVRDDHSVVYDIEMQNARRDNLPKRARYAQSLMDLDLIERGAEYAKLSKSYVIFLCRFNLIEGGRKHRYSFRNICVEDKSLELKDDTEKIFLCTEGKEDDVSLEMQQFLSFVAGKGAKGELEKKLENAVVTARKHPRWRKEYMDLQDIIDMELKEKAEALAELKIQLETSKKEADSAKKEADSAKKEADSAKMEADSAKKETEAMKKELAKYKEKFGVLNS